MVWQKVKESLRDVFAENVYNLWIEPLVCVQCDDESIRLACPDRFYRAHLAQHHLGLIQDQVNTIDGSQRQVVLCEASQKALPASPQASQLRLPHIPVGGSSVRALHPRYIFDEFMAGDSNLLALSACKSMVSGTDTVGPCLYINSSTGLGKSHLTHAVAHQILSTSPSARLHYLTAQQFSAEMVRNIQANSMDHFKRKYHDHCDILLVEDVHSLTGKKKTQEELNELLDSLIKGGKRVILTANSVPRDLNGIDDEFRSRMTSGLVTTIEAPDIQTRHRIVHKKAELQGLLLAEEFIAYLAQHIKGDVRQIESAILAIRAKSALMGGEVEMALVREVVEGIVGAPKNLSAMTIGEFVSTQFNVSVKEMQSRTRKKTIVFPRQVAMYLSRRHTQQSLADIGKAFGRDHATVLHAIKVVTDRITRDVSVSAQVELLNRKVKQI
ncbi:MAG: chromosomal replication initiator protein DnaA [Proteobacteria bacterium]|nr:chromosomal replication initiator protein DnaA [Pseudomonadota bacterium]MBU1648469.1 chromosomal replication initiator protein DnaA [Pseudomonadota bacterium]